MAKQTIISYTVTNPVYGRYEDEPPFAVNDLWERGDSEDFIVYRRGDAGISDTLEEELLFFPSHVDLQGYEVVSNPVSLVYSIKKEGVLVSLPYTLTKEGAYMVKHQGMTVDIGGNGSIQIEQDEFSITFHIGDTNVCLPRGISREGMEKTVCTPNLITNPEKARELYESAKPVKEEAKTPNYMY